MNSRKNILIYGKNKVIIQIPKKKTNAFFDAFLIQGEKIGMNKYKPRMIYLNQK
jgi:hypothetical protein